MSVLDFLKDRLVIYFIYIFMGVLLLIFMLAFKISLQTIVILNIIILFAVIVIELWEFFRRKNYYDKLKTCLNELDKKYLISEMIESPNFYDGQVLFEALQESNKSMCEHIAEYRHQNIEFREYIELWVHEIKLPVASLQLMCHNDNNRKYSEQLQRIDNDIENVLYYARSENAEKDYIIKEVSVKRIFADIAIKNREDLQQRNVNLKTENLDVTIMTDSKWLAYILGQLMGNSLKYFSSKREPEILIFIEDLPNQQILHFRDNGIGIPESDLPYIFEKSFTGENGRMYAKSTGMGLYIIKKLCDKLGHCILAESEQDKFTEIMIIFGKNNFLKF
ncbi:MAG: HAMP domain-containing histidine kinase [Ruminococcus sp.]|nr:HAMP domain-containing histidine kinase [Ruminococcus sp.]